MRFASVPGTVSVDQPDVAVPVAMHAVLGEGLYDCLWTEYLLDATQENYQGVRQNKESYTGARLSLKNGRDVVPDDPGNFMSLMSDGDVLQIDGYSISLATHGRNIIMSPWRENMGLNDFGFFYINFNRERTYEIACYYDWTDWYNTFGLVEP